MTPVPSPDVQVAADAPVVSRHEIVVEAPLQVVWDLHTDVAAWPSWHSDVDGTQLQGPLVPGAVFRWQTAGLDITSTVAQVDAPHRIAWGGPANGITGVHVWTFTPVDTGAGPGVAGAHRGVLGRRARPRGRRHPPARARRLAADLAARAPAHRRGPRRLPPLTPPHLDPIGAPPCPPPSLPLISTGRPAPW